MERKKPATYADLEALPTPMVGEIVDGELYGSPRPAIRHTVASSALGSLLADAFQFGRTGPGGWLILDAPELHFGEDVLVLNLAGFRREHLPALDVAFFEVAPDWVCEVLSPSTAELDRGKKMGVYARAGVGHLWLIDPLARSLETYRRAGDRWTAHATFTGGEAARAEPFDAIALELARLWV